MSERAHSIRPKASHAVLRNENAAFARGVYSKISSSSQLLHEKHLAGALHRAVELALVVRGQTGVFAREDATLVSHELPEQGGVFEVESVDCEVDLRLGPRSA